MKERTRDTRNDGISKEQTRKSAKGNDYPVDVHIKEKIMNGGQTEFSSKQASDSSKERREGGKEVNDKRLEFSGLTDVLKQLYCVLIAFL